MPDRPGHIAVPGKSKDAVVVFNDDGTVNEPDERRQQRALRNARANMEAREEDRRSVKEIFALPDCCEKATALRDAMKEREITIGDEIDCCALNAIVLLFQEGTR